jgi:hypothetical protein
MKCKKLKVAAYVSIMFCSSVMWCAQQSKTFNGNPYDSSIRPRRCACCASIKTACSYLFCCPCEMVVYLLKLEKQRREDKIYGYVLYNEDAGKGNPLLRVFGDDD